MVLTNLKNPVARRKTKSTKLTLKIQTKLKHEVKTN